MAQQLLKGLAIFVVVIALLYLAKSWLGDHYRQMLEPFMSNGWAMYTIFMVSETIVGILPPEFFMDWLMNPSWWPFFKSITILGALSYLGGILAFSVGKLLGTSAWFEKVRQLKGFATYQEQYEQYGGFLILIAAVTPIPFALVSTISGSLGYTWRNYFKFAIFRIARFWVYGYLMWQVAQLSGG